MHKQLLDMFNVGSETKELTKIPPKIKPKEFGKILSYQKGAMYQADLITMPQDGKYRYILVVVDVYDNSMDAQPLETKQATEVLKAFKTICDRKYLDGYPSYELDVDGGSEFSLVKKFLNKRHVDVKVSRPYRHSQQGVAEATNNILTRVLMSLQLQTELVTKKKNTEWVRNLHLLVMRYNLLRKGKQKKKPPTGVFPQTCSDGSCKNILKKGTRVRYLLDHPVDFNYKKQPTPQFRNGDVRWSKPTTIEDIIISPNQPILYKVRGVENALYKRKQLQLI